jgi:glycosyltransferase involved in cell wall biosynthesis
MIPRADRRVDERHGMEGLRLAMVASRFPPLVGGIETIVDESARRMAVRGLDVTVLTTDLTGELLSTEYRDGFTVRRFRAWPGWTDLYVSPSLIREIRNGRYDLVHVQGINNLLPPTALRASQRAGIPTVVCFHTGGNSSRLRTAVREHQWWLERGFLRKSTTLVASCQYEVEHFARRLRIDPGRIRLIRNGSEPLPVDGTPPAFSASPLISSVGRLERYKGHHRVIAAMPELLEAAPGAKLAIVGRGPYEKQLRRQVARLGVDQAVVFTSFGSTERAGLGALVSASDIVALLSDYEANPVAVMEAFALGRRVIVADTSGLTELGSVGSATVVPPDIAPVELARVLVTLAAQPEPERLDLPTWDDCVDEFIQVYAETVSEKR